MKKHIFFVVITFTLTAALIITVHLRIAQSRSFYDFRVAFARQARLKQTLWHKQIKLERMTSPSALSNTLTH